MRRSATTAAVAASLSLLAAPAFAMSDNASDTAKAKMAPTTEQAAPTPGPTASAEAKSKAYGKLCKAESKKHVKGEKGTAFSRCVTAMAKAANDETSATPKQAAKKACKTLSKKHVKGEKGTPFSRCVSAGAKLLNDQAAS